MSDCLTQPVSKLVMYKCRLDFNAFIIRSPAPSPPLNVQATQASASAPVEVSWSPPSGGAVPSLATGSSMAVEKNLIMCQFPQLVPILVLHWKEIGWVHTFPSVLRNYNYSVS